MAGTCLHRKGSLDAPRIAFHPSGTHRTVSLNEATRWSAYNITKVIRKLTLRPGLVRGTWTAIHFIFRPLGDTIVWCSAACSLLPVVK
jgi:hypothetical protein